MLISKILSKNVIGDYRIINEQAFDTLALCASKIGKKICTFLEDEKYINSISENATMIITNEELEKKLGDFKTEKRGFVIVKNPRIFFFKLHNFLASSDLYARMHFDTKIAETAKISKLSCISENNVIIEDNVLIEPYVTIYPNVIVGKNSIIRSGARIGGEGFEYKRTDDGIMSVTHMGGVRIGEFVEVQNNSCIDKAVYPWDDTVIGDYVKVDNLVHIAHAVKISKNTMVVAQSGIGGRVTIGENTWIGFGATIRNGIEIGENARTNMGAVVTKSVENNMAVSGNFAIEHSKFIEQLKKNN